MECIVSIGSFESEDESEAYGKMFVGGTSLLEEDDAGNEVVKGRILVFKEKVTEITKLKRS